MLLSPVGASASKAFMVRFASSGPVRRSYQARMEGLRMEGLTRSLSAGVGGVRDSRLNAGHHSWESAGES